MTNKDDSLIPPGSYCYVPVRLNEDALEYVKCPYWSRHWGPESNGAHCSYLDRTDEDGDPFALIWDQCKECGVQLDDDNATALLVWAERMLSYETKPEWRARIQELIANIKGV